MLDYLLEGENKFSKLLNNLEYEKHDVLHNIIVLGSKLGISPQREKFGFLILVCATKSKPSLKTIFQ